MEIREMRKVLLRLMTEIAVVALTKIFEDGGWWAEFYQRYPDSHGILQLSRVGFNKKKDTALVYAGNQREGLSGAGYCILLSKRDGLWGVQETKMVWIS